MPREITPEAKQTLSVDKPSERTLETSKRHKMVWKQIKQKTQDEQPRHLIQEVKHETLDGKPSETTLKKIWRQKNP